MELQKSFDPKAIEKEARERLARIDISRPSSGKRIAFIEGPPTMNGAPHAGHLRGRIIKDYWYRYQRLRGMQVDFRAGWDTQGLPIELQAQKELGIEGGKNTVIKEIGIERLVAECKSLVKKYHDMWVEIDHILGISFDQKNAYWTYRDAYIEREWQVLKKALKDGILEDDRTVIAYCPSCQASLSHAEVGQRYEMVKDPSLYYKVKLADEDAYFIVWTTMPFTIVTDAMVGFNPDAQYNRVRVGSEVWIVGKERTEQLMAEAKISEYTIESSSKGSEFEGRKYVHPLYHHIPELRHLAQSENYHMAVSEEFVDSSTGSGIVHLSPANGEEDVKIAQRRGVAVFCPINDEAKFTKDAGKYADTFVRDADKSIINDLRECGALVRSGSIKHKYPLCWRSGHRIIWMARRGWFYKLERLGDKAVRAAESTEYFFEAPRNRFLGIVRERHPWCISRERFWGCPLPAWNCNGCGNRDWHFTRKDIIDAAAELPDGKDFELHRPWIDNIKLRCTKCGSTDTYREPFVLDTWHNSGAAPFASLDDAAYSELIPAPFFTEGIDQTRGWAYTLLIENVILSGASPYGSFLFQGHVVDKDGSKMSKSLGNVIDAGELLSEHPADLVRFYFMWKSSPIEQMSFSRDELVSRPYQVLSTLYNLHLYYKQNSEYDKFESGYDLIQAKKSGTLEPPDIWLLSRLQRLISDTARLNDSCRFHEAARGIEAFVIDELSQTYVRSTRAQLWEEGKSQRRHAIYAILAYALKTIDVLLYPACPYITEYLYGCVFDDEKKSIITEQWPSSDPALKDHTIEESFEILRDAVSAAAAARMKGNLKLRWPLDEAIICVREGRGEKLKGLYNLLCEQLNVEKCTIHEMKSFEGLAQLAELESVDLPVVPIMLPNRKSIGPKAKQAMPEVLSQIEKMGSRKIADSLLKGAFELEAGDAKITLEEGDFEASFEAKGGFAASGRDGLVALVSVTRSAEMSARGLARDVARRLQALRKTRGYDPTDILGTASILGLEPEQRHMLEKRRDELAFLVRVRQIDFDGACRQYVDEDIDGQKIRISIE